MNDTLTQNLGFAHYWAQGDAVTHTVAYVLLLMSVASWYYILSKAWASWRIRKSATAVEHFWDAPTMDDAITLLTHADTERVYAPLATHAVEAVNVKAGSSSLTPYRAARSASRWVRPCTAKARPEDKASRRTSSNTASAVESNACKPLASTTTVAPVAAPKPCRSICRQARA